MDVQRHIKMSTDVIDSCEKRIKLVTILVKEAARHIQDCCNEQAAMIEQLRENLARYEGLRKKDFDMLMEAVLTKRKEKEFETQKALESLFRDEKDVLDKLRNISSTGDIADFEDVKTDILSRQQEKEKVIARLLMDLHMEQEELSAALKGLLSKGEKVRIRNFKGVVNVFKVQQRESQDEMDRMLDEVYATRQEVASKWLRLLSVYEKGAVPDRLSA